MTPLILTYEQITGPIPGHVRYRAERDGKVCGTAAHRKSH